MKKLILAILIAFVLNSCKKDSSFINQDLLIENLSVAKTGTSSLASISEVKFCGTVTETRLLAGRTIEAGNIVVGNDETNLYISIETTGGWELRKSHIFVGDYDDVPLNGGGNPQNGKFPYQATHVAGTTSYVLTLPLSQFSDDFIIAVHTEVVKVSNGIQVGAETGWGEGTGFPGKNWSMYFGYTKQKCTPPENLCYSSVSETAWASGLKFNPSGQGSWAMYVPYDGQAKSVTILAGQNNQAGTVIFTPMSNNKVKIEILLNGWALDENMTESVKVESYAIAPTGNPAPGLFQSYKGISKTIILDKANFYAIHLDVVKLIPCIWG